MGFEPVEPQLIAEAEALILALIDGELSPAQVSSLYLKHIHLHRILPRHVAV